MCAWRRAGSFSTRLRPAGSRPPPWRPTCRDHGTGPWGAPGAGAGGDGGPVVPTPARVGDDSSGVTVCMHVRQLCVTAASMIAELPAALDDGAPLRVFVAAGSPCASIFVPAFPRTAHGPPPYVPLELSGQELWHAADAVRRRVEDDPDPDVLAEVRATLQPVEDELWADADDVFGEPDRWGATGASWGSRALMPCVPASPKSGGRGGTLRRKPCAVHSYSPRRT